MLKWAGAGATASDDALYATGGNYDVFPMLVVGDEAFTILVSKPMVRQLSLTRFTRNLVKRLQI